MRVALALGLSVGCGRIAFDPAAVGVGDGPVDNPIPSDAVVVTRTLGERLTSDVTGVTLDTALSEFPQNQGSNFGANTILALQGDTHILVRFDLLSVPPGSTILDATLDVEVEDSGDIMAGLFDLRRVTEQWVEGTAMGAPGVASWLERDTATGWTAIGGSPGPTITSLDLGTLPGPAVIPLPLALVQSWVDDPLNNFGLVFVTPGNVHYHMFSREAVPETRRPQLTLTWREP